MVYAKLTSNPPQVHPIHVGVESLVTNFLAVAVYLPLRRVTAVARINAVPLVGSLRLFSLVLRARAMTSWTFRIPNSTHSLRHSPHSQRVQANFDHVILAP